MLVKIFILAALLLEQSTRHKKGVIIRTSTAGCGAGPDRLEWKFG